MTDSLDTSENDARPYTAPPSAMLAPVAAPVAFKYVRCRKLGFFTFPESMSFYHSDMADALPDTVVSAGFVRFVDGKPECYGSSLSLGVNADPSDTQSLRDQWGLS